MFRSTNHLLGLLAVLAGIAFHRFRGASCMVSGELFDLVSLLIENITGVPQILIDKFLILNIDEGDEVCQGDGSQRKTPNWQPFDQPVRKKGCDERLEIVWVLAKYWTVLIPTTLDMNEGSH
jgi:hypothetical protein